MQGRRYDQVEGRMIEQGQKELGQSTLQHAAWTMSPGGMLF